MAHPSSYQPSTGIERWLDARLPIMRVMHDQFMVFPTPRNLNYWWTFGGILTFMLTAQIITGIVLAMHYTPHVDHAFNSVEHIMRDVLPWGQMSFWAATVITNLFSAIPIVGDAVVTWLWGGYAVGNPTLQRFYPLHYLL